MLLQVGVDLGLPGLWAYATILILSLGLLLAALRRAGGRFAAAAVLGALAAVGGHGLFDAVLWGAKPAFLLWWLIGLAAVIYVEKEEDGASTIRTVTP
jgi:putative inorganic carbon (HCO3(-)) transporter